jgi:predicted amidohydrolase
MSSTADKDENLKVIHGAVARAASRGATLVCLPECCAFMGDSAESLIHAAETLDGDFMQSLQRLAKGYKVWVSVGGFPERAGMQDGREKVFNTHAVITSEGELASVYRKIHLFDCPLMNLHESNSAMAGSELCVVPSPVGRLGLSVCYDLRFPEMYTALCKEYTKSPPASSQSSSSLPSSIWASAHGGALGGELEVRGGAELVLVPSAFTVHTGRAHWEVLLRARAIENQCYIVAACQVGKHNEKRDSYGQSIIIDPWGTVLSECSKKGEDPTHSLITRNTTPNIDFVNTTSHAVFGNEVVPEINAEICYATISRQKLERVRSKMPIQSHRRPDIFSKA